jgi:uncharacterized protein YfcZ (UPF0381/DUF406 family)
MSAKNINEKGSAEAMKRFFKMGLCHNPVNYGDMKTGNMFSTSLQTIMDNIKDTSIVHMVYTTKEQVIAFLKELKETDLGLSVVVSGIVDEVKDCCGGVGLKSHTVEYSLGIWGKTDKLPDGKTLEITTMCGHHMVASKLVEKMTLEVKRGKRTSLEAAQELTRQCCCGVFNTERAAELIGAD